MIRSFTLLLLLPLPAFAEVSDKMPTQQNLWTTGLLLALCLGFAVRWSTWFNLLAWPLIALCFYGAYDLLTQADVGPAIIREQGNAYIVASYGSAALVLLGVAAGNLLRRRQAR